MHTHELNSQSVKEKIELQKGFILQLEEKKDKDIELKKKQLRVILDQQDSRREKISDANTMISEINEKIVASTILRNAKTILWILLVAST